MVSIELVKVVTCGSRVSNLCCDLEIMKFSMSMEQIEYKQNWFVLPFRQGQGRMKMG